MKPISRKEAFECALTQLISTAQVVNNGNQKLFDYALLLSSKSNQPIIPIQPLEFTDIRFYKEKSYAIAPITAPENTLILGICGRPYFESVGVFERIRTSLIPAKWIRQVLAKHFLHLTYDCIGVLSKYEWAYDTSLISKTHSEWVKYTNYEDDEIYYFPYYTPSQRNRISNNFSKTALQEIIEEFWIEE